MARSRTIRSGFSFFAISIACMPSPPSPQTSNPFRSRKIRIMSRTESPSSITNILRFRAVSLTAGCLSADFWGCGIGHECTLFVYPKTYRKGLSSLEQVYSLGKKHAGREALRRGLLDCTGEVGVDRGRHYTKGNAVARTPAPAVAKPGKRPSHDAYNKLTGGLLLL